MIPYLTQSYGGKKHEYGYHQFEALRKLSRDGFAVYYATNATICVDELFDWAQKGQTTQLNPLLDVGDLNRPHRYVTFTKDSSHFLLHSEVNKTGRISYEMVRDRVLEARRTPVSEDLEILPRTLAEYPQFEQTYYSFLKEYSAESVQARWLILHYVVSVLLSVTWMKLAVNLKLT